MKVQKMRQGVLSVEEAPWMLVDLGDGHYVNPEEIAAVIPDGAGCAVIMKRMDLAIKILDGVPNVMERLHQGFMEAIYGEEG